MVRDDGTWFRSFAEVPGVGYPGDPQRRARLHDRNVVPEVRAYNFDGQKTVSLMWRTAEGSTSASPARRLGCDDIRGESSAHTRERVLSALELPGELMDYHFLMQSAAESLYKRRRHEPQQLAFVEWLAWFDVRLVETHESLFRISPDKEEYLSVFALDFLSGLHEREGYLQEALALAERFSRFRRNQDAITQLRARVAQLRAEHA